MSNPSALRMVCVLFLAAACTPDMQPTAPADTAVRADHVAKTSARFSAWLDQEFATELDFSPLTKTRLGDKSDYDKLDDVSEAAIDRQLQWQGDSLRRMQAEFSREDLDEQAALSWDLWKYRFEIDEFNRRFLRHRFIFGRGGPHARLPTNLINHHEVADLADMQAYLSRLNASGRYIAQYLERARLAANDGIRAPYFDYQRTLSEIRRVLSGKPFSADGSSAIWADIQTKIRVLREADHISTEQADQIEAQARTALLDVFKPAYEEVAAWIEADRANVPGDASGAWSLPDGDEYYAARLVTNTTLPMSAQEIHDLGLSEVARIHAEMQRIQEQVGYAGSQQTFFNFMRQDDRFYFPNTETGREQYLQLADEYLTNMYTRLPDYFGILPKAGLQVRRVEAFREQAGAAAHYVRGTPDSERPGTFYMHLSDMRAVATNRLESLAYHEGVPGHHMQISIQQELTDVPRFRLLQGYSAFSEGWGLYAEYLAKEMGGYADPYNDFGRLAGENWRAVRLVVDTGIHAKRWTEAQAVEYALVNSSRPEASVRSEIRRYFNNPGQATAYKIGMRQIMNLRARSEAVLGESFDIRAFHDLILGSGPMPMPSLTAQVEKWLQAADL